MYGIYAIFSILITNKGENKKLFLDEDLTPIFFLELSMEAML